MIKLEKLKFEENGLILDDLSLNVENGEIYFLLCKDDSYISFYNRCDSWQLHERMYLQAAEKRVNRNAAFPLSFL